AKRFTRLERFIMQLIRATQKSTSGFVVKTFLCVATTLALLLSVRSSLCAGSATWELNSITGDWNGPPSSSFETARFVVPDTPWADPIFTDATVSAGLNLMGVA